MTSCSPWTHTLRRAILLFGLALPCAAQGQSGFASGRVVQEPSDRGLAGVALVVTDLESNVVGRGLSRSEGVFTLELPAGGPYRIRANSMGFDDAASDSFSITPGDTLSLPPLRMAPQAQVPSTAAASSPGLPTTPAGPTGGVSVALRAGAQVPERLERVDPGPVPVAPIEPDRIASHVVDREGVHLLGHLVRGEDLAAGHLVHASGAAAVHSEVPGGILGDVPVAPNDLQRSGVRIRADVIRERR
jgi:hypothetical protein